MLSPSRRLIVPLFVYLSLLLATAVDAHDVPLHLRDHGNMKRIIRKRSPIPQSSAQPVPPAVVGAAGIPTLSSTTESATSSTATSDTTSGTSTSTSATSTSTTSGTTSATESSSTTSASTTSDASTTSSSSSTSSTTSSTSSTPPAQTSASLNIIQEPAAQTSTIVPTFTKTAAAAAASDTETPASASGATATNDNGKSTAVTALIAVAASLGGLAILWTVFRKWKLSSSKKFDERLRPIDWQQPTEDDGIIPSRRRNSGASSFRSGSGHTDAGSRVHDPLDHDFTAGASSVGGYADLSRGPGAQPAMQEHLTRGPSFNRPFDNGVPLHHQGYGGTRY